MDIQLSRRELANLTLQERRQLADLLEQQQLYQDRRRFFGYYPDTGPLRRELYPRHLEFFTAGAVHRERCFMAANRVGKTEGAGGYEITAHLTGRYPRWWRGRRFPHPIAAWMAGKTNESTRDILQPKLFGKVSYSGADKVVAGTGMIPGEDILDVSWKGHDLIDQVVIQHRDRHGEKDGESVLGVKSYQQGRGAFEGTEKHVIWLDEEPEGQEGLGIYGECLTRTMTVGGILMLTFTPLKGMSQVVLQFMPGGKLPDGGIVESEDTELQEGHGAAAA